MSLISIHWRIALRPAAFSTTPTLACAAIDFLVGNVRSYDVGPLATYNFLAIPRTYNSNSLTYTLLKDSKDLSTPFFGSTLGSFGAVVPGGVPGWGKTVPHL